MAADADDVDVEERARGGHRARRRAETPYRHAGSVMHPEQPITGELLEQTIFDHGAGTADAFLRRLEDEDHLAKKMSRGRQVFRRAEQHDGMPVVAAGMHAAFVGRAVRECIRLHDGQRVHVRAQTDRGGLVTDPQHADNAGLAYAPMHFDAEFLQFLRHEVSSAPLLEAEFRMGVNIVTPTRERTVSGYDLFNERHCSSSARKRFALF